MAKKHKANPTTIQKFYQLRENGNLIELIVVMQYTVNVACIEENLILAKIMKENGKTYKYVIFVYNYQFYISRKLDSTLNP